MTAQQIEALDIVTVKRSKTRLRVLSIYQGGAALVETADKDDAYDSFHTPLAGLKLVEKHEATTGESPKVDLRPVFLVTFVPADARKDERVSLEFTALDEQGAIDQLEQHAGQVKELVSVEQVA